MRYGATSTTPSSSCSPSYSRVIAVDPGLRHSGIAHFAGGLLSSAQLLVLDTNLKARPTLAARMAGKILESVPSDFNGCDLVCEYPVVYGGAGQRRGDSNDLVALGGVGIALLALGLHTGTFGAVTLYEPRQWKGQVPKDVMGRRILSRLRTEETERILQYGARQHNVTDAIGIGLKLLGRLDK